MRQLDPARSREKGVVLAITLLILLIVTIAGVSGMSASTIQFNLSRNANLKHGAFQNAESALLTGEIEWDRTVTRCLNDPANCDDDISPPMIDTVENIEWDSVSEKGITIYGKYVVEFLGIRPAPGTDGTVIRLYRLTALGTSEESTARTLLQSIYQVCVRADGAVCEDQGED